MARLWFPAMRKLETENERLKIRLSIIEGEAFEREKEKQESIQDHRAEMQSLLDQNLSLERRLKESRVSLASDEALRAELEESRRQRDASTGDLRRLANENEELKRHFEKKRENGEEIEKVSIIDERIERLKKENATLKEEKWNLQKRFRDQKMEVESLKKEFDRACGEHSVQVAKNLECEMRVAELESNLNSAEDSLRHAHHQAEASVADAARAARDELRLETASRTALVVTLRAGLATLARECAALRKEQRRLRSQAASLPVFVRSNAQELTRRWKPAILELAADCEESKRRYLAEMAARGRLREELIRLRGNARVFARIKPDPTADGGIGGVAGLTSSKTSAVSIDPFDDRVVHVNKKSRRISFQMDRIFGPSASQADVFSELEPLVHSVADGYDVCIFAYGQTGSGKTYTMEGPVEDPGINQRAWRTLFDTAKERESAGWKYCIEVSVLEIHNDNIRDLLSSAPSPAPLEVRKISASPGSGQHVPGLSRTAVASEQDARRLVSRALRHRVASATRSNDASSRSHALVVATVAGAREESGERTSAKLQLVDLAGSERVAKSGVDGIRLKETLSINRSLSALSDVVFALRNRSPHVPYRNSKLTYLLEKSLAGDSKVAVIVQVSGELLHFAETVQSLAFGQRARGFDGTVGQIPERPSREVTREGKKMTKKNRKV